MTLCLFQQSLSSFINRNNMLIKDVFRVRNEIDDLNMIRGGVVKSVSKTFKKKVHKKLTTKFMLKAFVRSMFDPSYGDTALEREEKENQQEKRTLKKLVC